MTAIEPQRTAGATEMVSLTIDGVGVSVPRGTLVIRAAESMGVQIPRFCDHPLLEPVGACRQCLVEVEGQRKPMASCTTAVTPGMVVRTQLTSPAARSAQQGVMELLLINHPLDCPVCDKGGECPLQNQAMSAGRNESRFDKVKRTYPKPVPLSAQVLLDRERCVLCARCTRFSAQVAGDPFIELLERGAAQQVGVTDGFDSYFSGNTVQICPVGALTATSYRFRARPFDLVSSPSVCEHCASGCAQRTDHRRGKVLRRIAGADPDVNEEWNCDKGRWGFGYLSVGDRITTPMVREDGALRPASWPEALAAGATGLTGARAGVLAGGRLTVEDAYAYSRFARTTLHSNDIDFRIRAASAAEAQFLGAHIAGNTLEVTYADLEAASVVVLAGFDPEEESPMVFLRLRKAARTRGLKILSVAPFVTRGLTKLGGRLIMTRPGAEADALAALELPPGAVILVGERLATATGALAAAAALADRDTARLAWIPRRAGDRGALEAGCLPALLPGGRPVSNSRAREQVQRAWRSAALPTGAGRDTAGILVAAAQGELDALLVGGVDVDDLPDPGAALAAIGAANFVVSLELRRSPVTDRADVVFPVAPAVEKAGSFLNWEGRKCAFPVAINGEAASDAVVLEALSSAMGNPWTGPNGPMPSWDGRRPVMSAPRGPAVVPGPGEAVLATWRLLLDAGRLQDGGPNPAATARPVLARVSAATAAEAGAADGDMLTISVDGRAIAAPVALTDMPDRVVWLPTNSPGCEVHRQLRVTAGAIVRLRVGSADEPA